MEVLLAHMGGPYFAAKDEGAWSIPKGEYAEDEAPWDAARREFEEETGQPAPDGPAVELGQITQRNGKVVTAYALEGDFDPETMHSNTFELEWPPRSGRMQAYPEMDRAAWFDPDIGPGQGAEQPGRADRPARASARRLTAAPPRGEAVADASARKRNADSTRQRDCASGPELVSWVPGRAHAGHRPGGRGQGLR